MKDDRISDEENIQDSDESRGKKGHPVATGVGAVGGGAAGAAIGTAVGGPVGTAVGALVGAVAGGAGGYALGEAIDPAAEMLTGAKITTSNPSPKAGVTMNTSPVIAPGMRDTANTRG